MHNETHVLETSICLRSPPEEVFPYFADAGNLEALTPPELRFQIVTPLPIEMREGAQIAYRLRLFGVPFSWHTRIAVWEPPVRFVDVQERGPYRLWEHTHEFAPDGEGAGTRVRDRVRYQLPLHPVGEIALPVVRRQLDRIFSYRSRVLARHFGASDDGTGSDGATARIAAPASDGATARIAAPASDESQLVAGAPRR